MKEKQWVLIIEDEEELANLMGEELFEEGFDLIYSSKANDAKFKLDNQKFACILLDMNLAQGFGEDIIKHLSRYKGVLNYETPVIVISGSLDNSRILGIKDHIQAVMVKPFCMEALLGKVKILVSNNLN